MERRLEALERATQQRELEWSEWFDKFRRLYARLAQRIRQADEKAPDTSQDAPEPTIPRPAGYGAPPARRRNLRGF